jgi:beta-glucoside operon transcriptional antiterminator
LSKSMINFNYTKEKRIAWIVTGKQAKPILSRYLGRDIDLRLVFFMIGVESERYGALGMRIDRVINNNVVSAVEENGTEVVVMGKGVGFQMRHGMTIPEEQIEKVFRLDNPSSMDQFKNLVASLPPERLQISTEVIQYAKGVLNKKLSPNIYLTLTDHINFAIERFQDHMLFGNPLLREVRAFYKEEYMIGTFALDLIERRLGIAFPVDEAASIALHIVNAEYNTKMRDTIDITRIIQDVLDLVREYFQMELDDCAFPLLNSITATSDPYVSIPVKRLMMTPGCQNSLE